MRSLCKQGARDECPLSFVAKLPLFSSPISCKSPFCVIFTFQKGKVNHADLKHLLFFFAHSYIFSDLVIYNYLYIQVLHAQSLIFSLVWSFQSKHQLLFKIIQASFTCSYCLVQSKNRVLCMSYSILD